MRLSVDTLCSFGEQWSAGMDKLTCMRAFVAVVEAGGFSEAARRFGVSKALLSKQVRQLEEHLGVRLLHRTTRLVAATSSGQGYYEQCRPLLAELDDLDAAVQSDHLAPRGELRVTAPISFAELYLMSAVAEFSRRFPEVRLSLDLSDRFVDLIEERIDVAIRIGTLHDSSLVARRLGSTALVACASPDYLAAHGRPERPEQLARHVCIIDSNHPEGTRLTLGSGEDAVLVELDPRIRVNSARAVRELLVAGQGVGFLPSFAVAEDIGQGRLVHLLRDLPCPRLGIFAVYPHRKHLSAKVGLFIDTAVAHCQAASFYS